MGLRSEFCVLRPKFCIHFYFRDHYMPHPSQLPWFDHPNNIWWSVQVMKLLIIQSSPASLHFLPLKSKYSYKHSKLWFFLAFWWWDITIYLVFSVFTSRPAPLHGSSRAVFSLWYMCFQLNNIHWLEVSKIIIFLTVYFTGCLYFM